MPDARKLVFELEAGASPAAVPGAEQFYGYAVVGVPFRSGHILGMRRFPVSSVGPGYTSVWHRDPDGRWVIYQDQEPRVTCPRAFGPGIDDAPTVPIAVEWVALDRFTVDIETPGKQLHWEVPLSESAVTRVLGGTASILPRFLRHHPVALAGIGRVAGSLLRAGRLRLNGTAPSRQDFFADLRRIWLIEGSTAALDGVDLGKAGPIPEQAHLADFWLPQRGLFAIGGSFFTAYDPARHEQVASRRELGASPLRQWPT
jgi:hypothetical protein